MRINSLELDGAFLIEVEEIADDRGFFARAWCSKELAAANLNTRTVQANISRNNKAGTLRGLHFQKAPYEEAKYVRCTAGRIYDVIVDIRPDSETYRHWLSVELSADNHHTLYIPGGFAHGFQTLEDNSEVFYLHSEFFHPEAAGGLRWDDPILGIDWPMSDNMIISDKDSEWALIQS